MVLLHHMGQSHAHLLVMRSFPPKTAGRSCIPQRFVKFLNVTGSPATNAMFGIEPPRIGRPFRASRFISLHPGLKRPTSQSGSTELAEVLCRGWLFGAHLPPHEGR